MNSYVWVLLASALKYTSSHYTVRACHLQLRLCLSEFYGNLPMLSFLIILPWTGENFGSHRRVGLQVWMAVLARRMRYGEASGWPEGEFLSAPAMPSGSKFLNLPPSSVIRDELRPWSIGWRAGRCGHTTMLLIHGLMVSSLKLTLKMKRTSVWGEVSLYQIVIITEYGFSCL